MGWLFSPRYVDVRSHLVTDLARVWELVLLERYSFLINLSFALLLYVCGEAWRALDPDSGPDGSQLVVWGAVASKVCVYHAIWSANSVCHFRGRRRYETRDNSRNNIVVALLTFGDGWHHNHHYCPYSARHGFRWWEVDINFAILTLLSHLGVVWDLRMPPDRIAARSRSRPSSHDRHRKTILASVGAQVCLRDDADSGHAGAGGN